MSTLNHEDLAALLADFQAGPTPNLPTVNLLARPTPWRSWSSSPGKGAKGGGGGRGEKGERGEEGEKNTSEIESQGLYAERNAFFRRMEDGDSERPCIVTALP